jgi:hypothetical protein
MAKKEKVQQAVNIIPDGMKCFQKINGGSYRVSNRIIKPGQKFWIDPDLIPTSFKDGFKEVAPDYKAVIVTTTGASPVKSSKKEVVNVPDKFEVIPAVDEDGEPILKGKDQLYNVIGEDGKPINEKPLRKGKAEEYCAALNL